MMDQLGLDFKWFMGAVGLAAGVVLKYLHGRITALEDMVRNDREKSEQRHDHENGKLWKELNDFKTDMLKTTATKSDLKATEDRLMSAIRARH